MLPTLILQNTAPEEVPGNIFESSGASGKSIFTSAPFETLGGLGSSLSFSPSGSTSGSALLASFSLNSFTIFMCYKGLTSRSSAMVQLLISDPSSIYC